MATSIPERLRRQVRERAGGRCEYCLIPEADMYYPHEPDHSIAEKHGGPTSLISPPRLCRVCGAKRTETNIPERDAGIAAGTGTDAERVAAA